MNITILGSGTGFPSLRRSSCSVLVETEKNNILFDIGPGTIRRLLEHGLTVGDITHVVLTHFHPDHCGELASFLFALKYPEYKNKIRPTTLIGGKGIKELYQGLKHVFGRWIVLENDGPELIELDAESSDSLTLGDDCLKSIPVSHNPESLAYRIESKGLSFVVSGDTDESENLVGLASYADLLLCESSTPDGEKIPGHLTPSLAGRMAAAAHVKKLVLTHFYPGCDKTDIAKQCLKTYDGPLFLAEDLMKFNL